MGGGCRVVVPLPQEPQTGTCKKTPHFYQKNRTSALYHKGPPGLQRPPSFPIQTTVWPYAKSPVFFPKTTQFSSKSTPELPPPPPDEALPPPPPDQTKQKPETPILTNKPPDPNPTKPSQGGGGDEDYWEGNRGAGWADSPQGGGDGGRGSWNPKVQKFVYQKQPNQYLLL